MEIKEQNNKHQLPQQDIIPAEEDKVQSDEQAEMIKKLTEENELLKNQLEHLTDELKKSEQKQQAEVIEAALTPPVLDLDKLNCAEADVRKSMQEEYAAKMAEYISKSMLNDVSPAINKLKAAEKNVKLNEVKSRLSDSPELPGFSELLPTLDSLVAQHNMLEHLPPEDAYIQAYLIKRGVDSLKDSSATEEGLDKRLEKVLADKELMAALEAKKIESLKNNKNIPPLSASRGNYSAPVDISQAPTDFNTALERSKKYWLNK